MKDKLRELAERWKAQSEWNASGRTKIQCAAELLDILDAEGDGGAVCGWRATILSVLSALDVATGDSDPNIDPDLTDDEVREEYPEVWAMQKLTHLLDDTHPARSGVVSDEDVRDALRVAYYYDTTERIVIDEDAMRAALEHFAKGERHER